MSPFEEVEALYEKYPQQYTFEEDLRRYSEIGYVFSTPDSFIMGYYDISEDCWHIHAFAGKLDDAFRFIPFPAKRVSFRRRDGDMRYFDYEKILAKIKDLQSRKQ